MSLPQWHEDSTLKVVCRDCTAECCKHIGVPIDPPTTWEDFQAIKGYVAHEGVSCYLDVEGDWVVEFVTKCGQLNGNRCMSWGTAEYPPICAEYDIRTCVMNEEGDWWEVLFKTPEDVDHYCIQHQLVGESDVDSLPCVSVPIDAPEDLRDFDDIRWYLAHRDVLVYKKERQWYVRFNSICKRSCSKRQSHTPTQYDTVLHTWADVYAYCQQYRVPPSLMAKESV